jgi:predicted Rdx family selenoprotein
VRTVDEARERLQQAPGGASGAVSWAAALAGRTRKTLSWRGRAIPLSMAAKLGGEVVNSFRLGAYELEVLASLLVHRLRDAGLPVDARAVQRAVVNAYVSPGRDAGAARRPEVASASLAGLWIGRMMAVEPAVGRVTKAAEALLRLDRPALERIARAD